MAAGLTIDLENITPFAREMQNLNRVLDEIDDKVERFASAINRLDNAAAPAAAAIQNLKAAVSALSSLRALNEIDAGKLDRISDALARIFRSVPESDASAKTLRAMVSALLRFNGLQLPDSANFKSLTESIIRLLNNIGPNAKEAVSSVRSMGTALKNFGAAFSEVSRIPVNEGLPQFLRGIFQAFASLPTETAKITNFASFAKALRSILGEVRKIIDILGKASVDLAQTGSTQALTRALLDATNLLGVVFRETRKLTGLTRDIDVGEIDKVSDFVQRFGKNLQLFGSALRALRGIMQEVQVLVEKSTIPGLPPVVSRFVQFLTGIPVKSLASTLVDFTEQITRAFTKIAVIPDSTLRAIGTSIRAITGILKALGEIRQLTQSVRELNLSGGLRKPAQGVEDFDTDALFRIFTSIGNIGRRFGQVTGGVINTGLRLFGRSTELSRFLRGFRNFARVLSRALSGFETIQAPEKLTAVATLIRALTGSAGQPGFIQTIRDVVEAANRADDNLKSQAVNAALRFFTRRNTTFSRLLRGFSTFTKVLATGLNQFKRVRVSTNVIDSISRSIEAISKLITSIGATNITGVEKASNVFVRLGGVVSRFFRAFASILRGAGGGAAGGAGISGGVGIIRALASGVAGLAGAFRRGFSGALDVVTGFPSRLARGLSRAVNIVRQFGTEVQQQLRNIADGFRDFGSRLRSFGLTALTTGGVAGFFQSRAVQFTADFDQLINQIGVFGRITGDALGEVQAQILEFSAVTKFGPSEAADAFLGLQKAGLDAAESMAALTPIGNLAAAGQIDLAQATDLTITALNSFGLGVEETERVVNAFVAGADISTAKVEDFGQALGFVGPVASQLNIPIEDLSAAIALLNDRGIQGERAGTGLRAILQSLVAPTDAAKQTLDELVVSVRDAEGNFIGLDDTLLQFRFAIERLREEGLGDVQIIEKLSSLGDRNAISALFALIDEGSGTLIEFEDGSSRAATAYEEYRKSLENANSAQTVANALMSTFSGTLTSLKGSVQTLIITALQPFLNDVLQPILAELIKLVNTLTKLPKSVLTTLTTFVFFGVVLTTIAGAAALLTGIFVGSLAPALFVVAGLLQLLFNPVTLVAGIIAATIAISTLLPLIAALGALASGAIFVFVSLFRDIQNNTAGLRNELQRLLSNVQELFGALFELGRSFLDFFNLFGSAAREGQTSFERLSPLALFFRNAIQGINQTIEGFINRLREIKALFDVLTSTRRLELGIFGGEEQDDARLQNLRAQRDQILAEIEQTTAETGDALAGAYEVVAGDTLAAIAREFGVSLDAIKEANPEIENPNLIFPGQEIKIPGLDTGEVSDDLKELQDELAEVNAEIEGVGGRENFLERAGFNLEAINQGLEVARLTRTQAAALELLSNSPIFGELFGDHAQQDIAVVVDLIGRVETTFRNIFAAAKLVASGFVQIFSGQTRSGIDRIQRGLSDMIVTVLDLVTAITGIDFSGEILDNLKEGNFLAALGNVLGTISSVIIENLVQIGTLIGQTLGFLVFQALRRISFVGLARIITDILGIDFLDPVLDTLDDVFRRISNAVSKGVSLIFGVLGGQEGAAQELQDLILSPFAFILENQAVQQAFASLSASFTNFLDTISASSSGVDTGRLNSLLEVFRSLATEGLPNIIATALQGLSAVFDGLAIVLPIVIPLLESGLNVIAGVIETIAERFADIDSQQLQDILLGLAAVLGVVFAGAILSAAATVGIAIGAIVIGFQILQLAINPVLDLLENLGRLVRAVLSGDFREAGRALVDGIGNFLQILISVPAGVFQAVGRVMQFIANLFGAEELGARFREIGDSIAEGLVEGAGKLPGLIVGLLGKAIDAVKGFLGISSPSTLFIQIGTDIVNGLLAGLAALPGLLVRLAIAGIKAYLGIFRSLISAGQSVLPIIAKSLFNLLSKAFALASRIDLGALASIGLGIASALIKAITGIDYAAIGETLLEGFRTALIVLETIADFITELVFEGLALAIGFIGEIFSDLTGIDVTSFTDGIADLFRTFGDFAQDFGLLQNITGIFDALLGLFQDPPSFSDIIAAVAGLADSILDTLLPDEFPDISLDNLWNAIKLLFTNPSESFALILSEASAVFEKLRDEILPSEIPLTDISLDPLWDAISLLLENPGEAFTLVKDGAKALLDDIFNLETIGEGIDSLFGEGSFAGILGFLTELQTKVELVRIDLELALLKTVSGIEGLLSIGALAIQNIVNNVLGEINNIASKIGLGSIGEVDIDLEGISAGLDDRIAELEGKQITLEAQLEFQEDPDAVVESLQNAINNADFASVASTLEATGIELPRGIFQFATSPEEESAVLANLVDAVAFGEITPEEARDLLPDNLGQAFLTALDEELTAFFESDPIAGEGVAGERLIDFNDLIEAEAVVEDARQTGTDVSDGFGQGLADGQEDLQSAVQENVVDAPQQTIEDGWGTQSPSLFMADQGLFLLQGLVLGITQNLHIVESAVQQIVDLLQRVVAFTVVFRGAIQGNIGAAARLFNVHTAAIIADAQLIEQALQRVTVAALSAGAAVAGVGSTGVGAPPPPEGFQHGGFTGQGNNPFTATLHQGEYVVPSEGVPVVRETPGFSQALNSLANLADTVARSLSVSRGPQLAPVSISNDITIQIPEGTSVTPGVIVEGLEQFYEANPPQRQFRNIE